LSNINRKVSTSIPAFVLNPKKYLEKYIICGLLGSVFEDNFVVRGLVCDWRLLLNLALNFEDLIKGVDFYVFMEVIICYVSGCRGKKTRTNGLEGLYFLGVGGFCGTP